MTNIKNNIIYGTIIFLFISNLAININELLDFFSSKFISINSPFKSEAPRYENLYRSYCENNFYIINNLKLKHIIIMGFTIFSLLFIIFWYNFISNSFLPLLYSDKISLNGEIRLLFYEKTFNKIKSVVSYETIYYLQIYIFILFFYYLGTIISTYNEYNKNEKNINNSINTIDEIVKDNIKCELYNYLIYKEEYEQNTEILSKYIKRNKNSINALIREEKITEIMKILFTYEISTRESFHHKNKEMSLQNKENKDNNAICAAVSNCFFSSLSNSENNKIFSDYEILESRDIISELINHDQTIMEELRTRYISIKTIINSTSATITRKKDEDLNWYKSKLVFVNLTSVYYSLYAIIFFVFFELKYFNKLFNGHYVDIDVFNSSYSTRNIYIYLRRFLWLVLILLISIIIL